MENDRSESAAVPERSWNYRVIEIRSPDGESYRAFHEVHYKRGVPVSYSENPAVIGWDVSEGVEAPLQALERMREALEKPVLTDEDFPPLPDDTLRLLVYRGEDGKWFGKLLDAAGNECGSLDKGCESEDDVAAYARASGIYPDSVEYVAERR